MKTVFWDDLKKGLHVILHMLGTIFFKSKHIGCHFCPYFLGFCEGFKFFTDFAQISMNFAWIFTKSKLLGVCFHPYRLHHWLHGKYGV